ncbi:MAG: helix-turn-helix transcriptional regulator [Oxalobacter sp.]|nr:helix-turn-helix transcriptional regulator [Oxalobacter sp.]
MENSVQQAETAGGADAGTAQVEAAPALMAETKAGTTVPQKTAAAEEDRRSANDMTLLAVRLRTAMAKIGMTQAQLARACGVKPPSVSGWLNSKAKYLKGKNLLAAAKALNVSQDWLATGEGAMLPYDDDLVLIPNLPSNEFVEVSILNTRQSVLDDRFEEHLYEEKMAFRKTDLIRMKVSSRTARVLAVPDSSMVPTLSPGGFVLINTEDTQPQDTKVYAFFYDGQWFLRRLVWDFSHVAGERVWVMRCDNPDRLHYPDRRLPPDAAILGRVVWYAGML